MKDRNLIVSLRWFFAGLVAITVNLGAPTVVSAAIDDPAYAGRRVDHVAPLGQAAPVERAAFAAMETRSSRSVSEPAYSGRRADHLLQILNYKTTGDRAEFAAMEGRADAPATSVRAEMAYGGRRADHLELYR